MPNNNNKNNSKAKRYKNKICREINNNDKSKYKKYENKCKNTSNTKPNNKKPKIKRQNMTDLIHTLKGLTSNNRKKQQESIKYLEKFFSQYF